MTVVLLLVGPSIVLATFFALAAIRVGARFDETVPTPADFVTEGADVAASRGASRHVPLFLRSR